MKVEVLITESFREQYQYLCKKISNIEWCASFFYKKELKEGEDESTLLITPISIYLRDIGSHAHTEHTADGEYSMAFANAQMDGLSEGLIHSHHNMSVFFSEEDKGELAKTTPLKVLYPSIIVGNLGDIICRVGFNIQSSTVKVFDNVAIDLNTESCIYVDAKIVFEVPQNNVNSDLEAQIARVKKQKEEARKYNTSVGYNTQKYGTSANLIGGSWVSEPSKQAIKEPKGGSVHYNYENEEEEEEGELYHAAFNTHYKKVMDVFKTLFKCPKATNKAILYQLVDLLDVQEHRTTFFGGLNLTKLFSVSYERAVEVLYLAFYSEAFCNDCLEDSNGLLDELEETIKMELSKQYPSLIDKTNKKFRL